VTAGRLRGLPSAAALAVASAMLLATGSASGPSHRCRAEEGEVLIPAPGARGAAEHIERAFLMDRTEVTVAQFRQFVASTGYQTEAERVGWSAVFQPPAGAQSSSSIWVRVRGADWRHPEGPDKAAASPDNPVTQVTYADSLAYARWRGRDLPTDAEWERAARGGDPDPSSSLKWAYSPRGTPLANTWQGLFPYSNTGEDGFDGVAPVGCFRPNGYGLHDMIGNVWELTRSHTDLRPALKGGSYLCSFNGCANFRPSAEIRQAGDFGTSHVGFRTIRRRPTRAEQLH